MEHNRRPPSLNLSSSSPARPVSTSPSPQHRQSQSPFRYIQLNQDTHDIDEKSTPLTDFPGDRTRQLSPGPSTRQQKCPSPLGSRSNNQPRTARLHDVSLTPHARSPFLRQPTPLLGPNRAQAQTSSYSRPRGLRIANLIRPWLPLILYAITSFAVVIAVALYKAEVFNRLDELSLWLQSDVQFGYAMLFFLIFLTTFPPIPLYSTLITLSGYTFGPWTGAIISYFAALAGALTVFIISRTFFRDCISRWLSSTLTVKRVVRAVEKRPKLLFLIRLAPYPYNVMNCLLAASPTLTLRTFAICTALSLFKVIIHTSMGASIHSFKDYHVVDPNIAGEEHEHTIGELWTALGIALCIAILVYISIVARKAVDNELDDEPITSYDAEETTGFLTQSDSLDLEAGSAQEPMAESPFRHAEHLIPYRPSMEPVQTNGQWS
ncbi:Golgi apparatus membrane protein tvp38 [Hypsizygus marmoreus]|uniref:Golgi apparatus membrane protein TVP38 n=1 Tax=Hypsizygus marmoreus TaxID=39966 RepID=A0A369JSE2_HYPMA|nr:Golgi apparatus membrane protein tvp38 [Hypsizygus marmoreus]